MPPRAGTFRSRDVRTWGLLTVVLALFAACGSDTSGNSEDGTTLTGYTNDGESSLQGFGAADFEDAEPVITGTNGGYVSNTSLAPDGHGFVFGGAYGADTVATAAPFDATAGWSAAEPIHGAGYSPTNGLSGASLGGGEALVAFGSLQPPAVRVQLFASYRSFTGSWTLPKRFDSGDDSSHAMLHSVVAGAPGEAFALWQEPDGFSAGRFDGSEDLGDEIEFGTAFNYWSLAADRCGNAAVFYSTSGTNDAHYRYYRRGVGWLAASTIETDATTASVHKHLTFSSKGEAMLLLVRSDRVRALALTHQDHLGIDNCVRDDDCIVSRSAQHDVISGRHVVKTGTPTAPGCDAHRGKGAVYTPMIPRLPIRGSWVFAYQTVRFGFGRFSSLSAVATGRRTSSATFHLGTRGVRPIGERRRTW